jgi:hypothetical protein
MPYPAVISEEHADRRGVAQTLRDVASNRAKTVSGRFIQAAALATRPPSRLAARRPRPRRNSINPDSARGDPSCPQPGIDIDATAIAECAPLI